MEKIHFIVGGLTCGACAKIVKSRLLKRIDSIKGVDVEENGNVVLSSNNQIDRTDIEKALRGTDFKVVSFN